MVHAFHRAEGQTRGRVGDGCCETVDSNLHLRLFSCPEPLGALTNLFQYRFQTSHFFWARIGKHFSNLDSVSAKHRRNQSFAFWFERYDADAPVFVTLDPAYQAPI